MFLGRTSKPNNIEDPMVSVNCLRMFARHALHDIYVDHMLFQLLVKRLLETAELGLAERLPFSNFSKCYFSWGHYLLRLYELIYAAFPQMLGKFDRILDQYFAQVKESSFLEDSLELEYATLLANVSNRCYFSILSTAKVHPWQKFHGILYQHQRLRHYYGSPWWTRLVELLCQLTKKSNFVSMGINSIYNV